MLQISDESIQHIIQQCVICNHTGGHNDICNNKSNLNQIFLRKICSESTIEYAAPRDAAKVHTLSYNPIPGLCDKTTRLLEDTLQYIHLYIPDRKLINQNEDLENSKKIKKCTSSILKAIELCNQRVLILSSELPGTTHALRVAGRQRCQICRDQLQETLKRLKVKQLTLLQKNQLLRDLTDIFSVLKQGIHDAIASSVLFCTWEIPDPRVKKLGLSSRQWASGFPDPEYYKESKISLINQRHENKKIIKKLHDLSGNNSNKVVKASRLDR